MLHSTTDMLALRWRASAWMLAAAEGDRRQAAALRDAMRVEGLEHEDVMDEITLLIRQFGHRPIAPLRDEVTRLWLKLKALCARCGQASRYLDNDNICAKCVAQEPT